MKTLLAVVALCLSAAGQAVYSGAALSSGSLMYGASAGAFFGPTLPAVWVDNNEALDGVNCGGQCSGAGFVAPTYE
ncbi:MAG TPA: hypothetical protein VGV35_16425, partial [Bryobacteraceae bacterium]|nr:hypothetical protein [Bryobacteraceae bacterium]